MLTSLTWLPFQDEFIEIRNIREEGEIFGQNREIKRNQHQKLSPGCCQSRRNDKQPRFSITQSVLSSKLFIFLTRTRLKESRGNLFAG